MEIRVDFLLFTFVNYYPISTKIRRFFAFPNQLSTIFHVYSDWRYIMLNKKEPDSVDNSLPG